MKKQKWILAGLMTTACALATTSALAQVRGESGWYLGGSIGQSEVDIEDCGGAISCDEKDTAWRFLGGYQINRNFAVELGYHQFGDASASGPANSRIDFESNAFELVGLAGLPLGNQFLVYGKAGIYRGETKATGRTVLGAPIDIKETNTDLTYGIGAQYNINRQLGIRAEWQRYTNMGGGDIGESDVNVMSVGLVIRFQ